MSKKFLLGHEVLKIERLSPGTLPAEIVSGVGTKGDREKRFEIGEMGYHPKIFLRPPIEPSVDLVTELKTAISKKVDKRHGGKEDTILLLDNLTTQSNPDEFFDAFEKIRKFLDTVPFRLIWLYTGYYSDDRGYDCEFSLIPIKLSEPEMNFLRTNS